MKIRAGFVSNSSSSSFLMIGTSDKNICAAIAQQAGIPEDLDAFWDWVAENATGYGTASFEDIDIVTDPCSDTMVWCVGIMVGGDEESERDIDGLGKVRDRAIKILSKCSGMNVPCSKVKLIFGESSNES
jgi:hypothetical protein